MGVHDVERGVVEGQVIHVTGVEPYVGPALAACLLPGVFQHVAGRVDADHIALGNPGGQVDGDGPGAATHVEHPVSVLQPR